MFNIFTFQEGQIPCCHLSWIVTPFPQQKNPLYTYILKRQSESETSFPKNDYTILNQMTLSFMQSNLQIDFSQSKLIAQLNYSLFGNLCANIAV